jgi:hypothetical protein
MDISKPQPPAVVPIVSALKDAGPTSEPSYHPLSETIAIYLGWLLFWCGALYVVGGYQAMKKLPVSFPIVDQLITSPFVLIVSLGAFLYLMLSAIHRLLKGGALLGLSFFVIGLVAVWLYGVNIR